MNARVSYSTRPQKKGKVTLDWDVWSNAVHLGRISWHSPWRRYCFFPADQTLYDASCLNEIAEFCSGETNRRKAVRAANQRVRSS